MALHRRGQASNAALAPGVRPQAHRMDVRNRGAMIADKFYPFDLLDPESGLFRVEFCDRLELGHVQSGLLREILRRITVRAWFTEIGGRPTIELNVETDESNV